MPDENASDNAEGPNFELGAIHNGMTVVSQDGLLDVAKLIQKVIDTSTPNIELLTALKARVISAHSGGGLPPCPPGTPAGTFCD